MRDFCAAAYTIVGPFTLNLHGFTISCVADSAGVGVGIDLTGVRAQVQDGTVADCGKGVVVEGNGRHELRRLIVTSPDLTSDQGIGFQVKSDRNRFIENAVQEYAGEGFRLGDDDVPANRNVLVRNEATDNANHGFRVRIGQQNLLLLNHAEHNATEGFRTQDGSNRFIANTAIGNGDEGFRLSDVAAQDNAVIGNTAEGNGLPEDNDQISCNFPPPQGQEPDINPGIVISNEAANNKIIGNAIQGNCVGIGVETGSQSNEITKNVAFDNSLIDLADGNLDCDDNDWRINVFETSAAGPRLQRELASLHPVASGQVLTLQLAKGDLVDPLKALEMGRPGDLIVVDTGGDTETSVCGGARQGPRHPRHDRDIEVIGAGAS